MKTVLAFLWLLALCLAGLTLVYAAEDCALAWDQNPASDGVVSYQIYARPTGQLAWGGPRFMTPKTSATCREFTRPITYEGPWQFVATARDLAGNEGPASTVRSLDFGAAANVITDLRVDSVGATSVIVNATVPAGRKILIRVAKAPINWGATADQTCQNTPCLVSGLSPLTTYETQAVFYIGVLGSATFDPISAPVRFTTTGTIDPPPPVPPPVPPPPPPGGPAFSNIQNGDDAISFTFEEARCPKGTRRFIKGRDTKTITITCEK